MHPKVDFSLNGLSDAAALVKAVSFNNTLMNHPVSSGPWHPDVPTLAKLKEDTDRFREAINAALNKDRLKIVLRDAARRELENTMYYIGLFLIILSRNDPNLLVSTGLLAAPRASKSNTFVLGQPVNYRLKHGDHPGTITAKVNRLRGAISYEVQFAVGDPTVEANWMFLDVFGSCSDMVYPNLNSGTKYSFRIRGIGKNSRSPWSAIVSLISM
jgi:hypothetical protein